MGMSKFRVRSWGSQRAAVCLTVLLCLVCPGKVIAGVVAPGDTVGRSDLNYFSLDGFRIYASYYRPPVASDRAAIIFPDPKEGRRDWDAIADTLRRHGIHVLVPELRGTGESIFQRGIRRDRARFSDTELTSTSPDAVPALRFIRQIPGATIRSIAMIGSGGGTPVALHPLPRGIYRGIRILISPRVARGERPDSVAARDPEPRLTIVSRDDVLGIEAAAIWIGEDPLRPCWIVDAPGQGSGLMRTRLDLLEHLVRWMERPAADGP